MIHYDSIGAQTPLSTTVRYEDRRLRSGQYYAYIDARSKMWRLNECTKILLEAGADPTITDRYSDQAYSRSSIEEALDWRIDCEPGELLCLLSKRSFLDLEAITSTGLSIWLHACLNARQIVTPSLLQDLLDAGFRIDSKTQNHAKFPDGWNCLFMLVLNAQEPEDSHELETLRFLLRSSTDVFAKDATGLTVFDHVASSRTERHSSYQRDLWYCALQREGVDVRSYVEVSPRTALYDDDYTPEHYSALRFLDEWDGANLERKVSQLLKKELWTEEEVTQCLSIYKGRGMERTWETYYRGDVSGSIKEVLDP